MPKIIVGRQKVVHVTSILQFDIDVQKPYVSYIKDDFPGDFYPDEINTEILISVPYLVTCIWYRNRSFFYISFLNGYQRVKVSFSGQIQTSCNKPYLIYMCCLQLTWAAFRCANYHYENMPIQIYWKSDHQKRKIFRWKILIFFIFLFKT